MYPTVKVNNDLLGLEWPTTAGLIEPAARAAKHRGQIDHVSGDPRGFASDAARRRRSTRDGVAIVAGIMLLFIRADVSISAEPESLSADAEARLKTVTGDLSALRDKEGRAPSADDLIMLLDKHHALGELAVMRRAWDALRQAQRPRVSKEAVREIVRAKRESIAELHARMRFSRTESTSDGKNTTRSETCELATSGPKQLLRVLRPESSGKWPKQDSVMTYDGQVVRLFQISAAGNGFGSVDHFGGRAPFNRPDRHLLWAAMLVDSQFEVGMDLPYFDLVRFLGREDVIAFEEPLTLRGHRCLIASSGELEVAMAMELNFAVVRFAHRMARTNPPWTQYAREMDGFKDCGNGLWLPMKSTTTCYRKADRTLEFQEVLAVEDLSVNEPLADSVFTDIFPRGLIVSDGVRGLVYRVGEDASVQGMLDRALIPRKTAPLWWSLALLALIGVAAAMIVRRMGHAAK